MRVEVEGASLCVAAGAVDAHLRRRRSGAVGGGGRVHGACLGQAGGRAADEVAVDSLWGGSDALCGAR